VELTWKWLADQGEGAKGKKTRPHKVGKKGEAKEETRRGFWIESSSTGATEEISRFFSKVTPEKKKREAGEFFSENHGRGKERRRAKGRGS